jgi:hypothetical protein
MLDAGECERESGAYLELGGKRLLVGAAGRRVSGCQWSLSLSLSSSWWFWLGSSEERRCNAVGVGSSLSS